MTKSETRKARKLAHIGGRPLTGEVTLPHHPDQGAQPVEFSETPRGDRARDHWARRYEDLNGAPESEYDH